MNYRREPDLVVPPSYGEHDRGWFVSWIPRDSDVREL
jgi:hypothetical protein